MTVDFKVDIGHLLTLRSRLCALHADLVGGGGGSSGIAGSGGHGSGGGAQGGSPSSFTLLRANLDPRTALPGAVIRANRDSLADYAYGKLNESNPLGQVHDQVAESVLSLVDGLQEMVEAMISAVGGGGARYGEAESSVTAAIAAVADSDGGAGSGGGLGSESGPPSAFGSGPGSSSGTGTDSGSGSGGGSW